MRRVANASSIRGGRIGVRQAEHGEHQPGRFVNRSLGTVAVSQAGRVETRGESADQVFDRDGIL